MLLKDTLNTAFNGITVNKSRSILTALGIIIGVASVVLMVSMGRSFQNYILTTIESVGTNTMDIFPVGLQRAGSKLDSLTYEDYLAVKRLSTVENSTPVILVGKKVEYGKESVSPTILGSYNVVFANYSLKLDSGRLLEQADEDGAKSVIVIGPQAASDLFGGSNVLGKVVKIGGSSFTVVGVLQKAASSLLANLDSVIVMPYSSAKAITGQTYLSYITLKTVGDQQIAKEDVTQLLRQRHRISNPLNDPDKDDFIARSADQITAIVSSVTLGLTIFLSLVAAISLLVGGIGIMNIMLVSVTERTKEIGLRKAVGASKRDILLQFLFEAVALTVSGGLVGIVIGGTSGWIMSLVANRVLGNFSFVLSIPSVLLAVAMAVGTGLLFGIYPARRASNLSPMEALRFE